MNITKTITIDKDTLCYVFNEEYEHKFYDDHDDEKASVVHIKEGFRFNGYMKSLCVDTFKVVVFKNTDDGKWYKFYWTTGERDPYTQE